MANLAVGIWFILYGVLNLVSTEIPKWILPLSAVIVGLIVLYYGWAAWRKTP